MIFSSSSGRGLNPRPSAYKADALPLSYRSIRNRKMEFFFKLSVIRSFMEEPVHVNLGRWTILFILICILFYILPIIPLSFGAFNFSLVFLEPWRTITHMFLHSSFPHLFYNMLNLFVFGNLIEAHHGSKVFLAVSIVSGISGAFLFGFLNPNTYSVGISGVVFGLIGSCVVMMPNAKALLPIGGISVPAKVKIAGPIMALGELLMGFLPSTVGHHAHFGGFFAGILLAFFLSKKHDTNKFHLHEVEI